MVLSLWLFEREGKTPSRKEVPLPPSTKEHVETLILKRRFADLFQAL